MTISLGYSSAFGAPLGGCGVPGGKTDEAREKEREG